MKKKLNEIKGTKYRDRYYKIGDVIRYISTYDLVHNQGLGIVVEADGPIFKAYWTGDEKVRNHDARPIGYSYILQDIAPVPQVAEWLKKQDD